MTNTQTETTEQKYIVILTNGATAVETNLDLKAIQTELNKRTTLAVKVGKKGYSKNMLNMIVKEESTVPGNHNLATVIGGYATYNTVNDTNKAIEQVTESVNTQPWVLFNETTLFNRNAFEYIETIEVATQ